MAENEGQAPELGLAVIDDVLEGRVLSVDDRRLQQLALIGEALDSSVHALESVHHIASTTVHVIQLGLELQAQLRTLELEIVGRRDRLKALAPGMLRNIEKMNERLDGMVDKIIGIDPSSCSDAELVWRNRLVDLAESHTNAINQAILQLMAI